MRTEGLESASPGRQRSGGVVQGLYSGSLYQGNGGSTGKNGFPLHGAFECEGSLNNEEKETDSVVPVAKRRRGSQEPEPKVVRLTREELIAPSPKVCEICKKAFKSVQYLNRHLRVHKNRDDLHHKNRSSEENRKKVYPCPELKCVHHDEAKALADLTGIKKHFLRKHCEKNLMCEKCEKQYAMAKDLEAHEKICDSVHHNMNGAKEYTCDTCKEIFPRRDIFTIHRELCHALAGNESPLDPQPPRSAKALATGAPKKRLTSQHRDRGQTTGGLPEWGGQNVDRDVRRDLWPDKTGIYISNEIGMDILLHNRMHKNMDGCGGPLLTQEQVDALDRLGERMGMGLGSVICHNLKPPQLANFEVGVGVQMGLVHDLRSFESLVPTLSLSSSGSLVFEGGNEPNQEWAAIPTPLQGVGGAEAEAEAGVGGGTGMWNETPFPRLNHDCATWGGYPGSCQPGGGEFWGRRRGVR